MSAVILAVLIFSLGWVVFQTQHTPWVEMITYPYLLNHGFTLYKDLTAPYTPLFLWFLQGSEKLFGYTPQFSQWLTLLLAATNTLLIFFLSKRLWKNNLLALISAAFYVLWFQYFEGNGLWFELAQTPFILLSFYYFYRYFFSARSKKDLIFASIALALAFFMKQSALWIVLAVVVWAGREIRGIRDIREKAVLFLAPFLTLFTITSMVAFLGGYLKDYWWWAYYYTFIEFPFTPGHNLYPTMPQIIKLGIPLVVLLPLVLQVFSRKKEAVFSLIFLAAAGMAILPRWSLFHLQPFLALLAVAAVPRFWRWLEKGSVWKNVTLVVIAGVWVTVTGRQAVRFYGLDYRFWGSELIEASAKVKSLGGDTFIFNAPDQLYVLSGTVPAVKPYVQNFAWQMEVPGIQESVVQNLETNFSGYVLYSPVSGRGGFEIGDYRPQFLGDYIDKNFTMREKLAGDLWVLERKTE